MLRERTSGLNSYALFLRALLVVALAHLALGVQPIFGLMARFKTAALGEQVCKAADFLVQVDGGEVGSAFRIPDLGVAGRGPHFWLLQFRRCWCEGCGRGRLRELRLDVGRGRRSVGDG